MSRKHITPIGNDGIYTLDTASWRTERPVMNKEKCSECGMCLTYCPVNAIAADGPDKFKITYDFCKGCGICAVECPRKAIDMLPEGGE